MAKSDSIYIVALNHHPLMAFTVKHELEEYLDAKWAPTLPTNMRIMQLPDAGDEGLKDITKETYHRMKERAQFH